MNQRGVSLSAEFLSLKGKKFHPPKLMDPESDCRNLRTFSEFKQLRIETFEPLVAQGDTEDDFDGETSHAEWAFVYHHTDADIVNQIISKHKEAQKALGMQL